MPPRTQSHQHSQDSSSIVDVEGIARSSHRFDRVPGRGTVDYALRTVQQTQTQLSSMADTKASIMVTICSIVSTVGIARLETSPQRWPLVVLVGSVLAALLFAVLAVLPSLTPPRTADGTLDLEDPSFNLFFFGHFAKLPRERFETMLADVARHDATIYAMIARDIYGQGLVLASRKYRMLRWSYILFFAGMFATAVTVVATRVL